MKKNVTIRWTVPVDRQEVVCSAEDAERLASALGTEQVVMIQTIVKDWAPGDGRYFDRITDFYVRMDTVRAISVYDYS